MKTIILLSGGIDSALTAYLAREDSDIVLLNIDYGQSMEEFQSAYSIAEWFQMEKQMIQTETCFPMSRESHVTNFIPARNQILLSIALAYAIDTGCNQIAFGANKDDNADYVDCRIEWIQQFKNLSRIYLPSLEIYTPLLTFTKKDIISYAIHKGIPLELTRSCYTPVDGLSCGTCNACRLRLQSFSDLGLEDPISYV